MTLIVTPDGYVVDDGEVEVPPTDEVMSPLNDLLVSLPGYALITNTMKVKAIQFSLVPDGAGVWPTKPGYVMTYDPYWAAIQLVHFLQAQPVVRSSSSEGTSVSVDPPNWTGLLAYYRSMSKIAGAHPQGVLGTILIPDVPHVTRTDMSGRDIWGRRTSHGDIDTDLG